MSFSSFISLEHLQQQLAAISYLNKNDVLMLHVSLRAVGKILGDADILHQVLLERIAPRGTLMMYVGCAPEYEMLERKELSLQDQDFLLKNTPAFNYKTARARQDYGVMAELFRSWPDTCLSQNPGARIAARGPLAEWLTADHPLNYGYGPYSPFDKLIQSKGKILLIGSDFDQVTILHYAEHLANVSHKKIVHYRTPLLKNHTLSWEIIEEYDTSQGIRNWPDRFFAKIIEAYIDYNQCKSYKIGHAETWVLDGQGLVKFAIEMFENQAQLMKE